MKFNRANKLLEPTAEKLFAGMFKVTCGGSIVIGDLLLIAFCRSQ